MNKMEFTCIVCEFKFPENQMEIDERMCHDCFEEDTRIEYTNNLIRDRVDRENYRKNLKTSYSSLGWKEEDHGSK